jgi:hypothetical protein
MTLKTDILNDVAIFFDTDDFGLAATYTVKGGTSGIDVTVILDQVQDAETAKQSRGEAYYAHQGRLWCQVSEVAAPHAGDSFLVGTDTWIVQEVIGGNTVAWELAVYRSSFAGKIR